MYILAISFCIGFYIGMSVIVGRISFLAAKNSGAGTEKEIKKFAVIQGFLWPQPVLELIRIILLNKPR